MKVYIIHAHADEPIVQMFMAGLTGSSISFFNPKGMEVGEDLPNQLKNGIEESSLAIWLVTKISKTRDWCKVESGAFWGAGKPIILYLCDETSIHELPEHLHASLATSDLNRVLDKIKLETLRNTKQNIISIGSGFHKVYVDSNLNADILKDRLPNNWHARAMYIGRTGAMNWLRMLYDPGYLSIELSQWIFRSIAEFLKSISIDTFVSLGSGNGQMDESIITLLKEREQQITYIPIDINEHLLALTLTRVSRLVPKMVPILSDFEAYLPIIQPLITDNSNGGSILFSMLGYTFGNLDGLERSFLSKLKSIMKKGDYFLVDYLLVPTSWNSEDYHQNAHNEYTNSMRQWLCYSVSIRAKENIDNLVSTFNDRFSFQKGYSDIPGAYGTEIVDTHRNCDLVSHMRRYSTIKFCDWLVNEIGLEIVVYKEMNGHNKYSGTGILLAVKC